MGFGWILWAPAAASALMILSLWRQGSFRGRWFRYAVIVFVVAIAAQSVRSNALLWFIGFTLQLVLAGTLVFSLKTA